MSKRWTQEDFDRAKGATFICLTCDEGYNFSDLEEASIESSFSPDNRYGIIVCPVCGTNGQKFLINPPEAEE